MGGDINAAKTTDMVGEGFGRNTSESIVCSREPASYARPLGPSIVGGWIPPEKRRVGFDILYLSYFLIDDRICFDFSKFIPHLLDSITFTI